MASIPTRGPTATRDGILALAREGERLGLHSAMIADHIVFPVESRSTYPYTVDGKHPSVGDALEGIPSPDGSRRPFSGEPEEIAEDIRTFATIGVHELIFDFRGQAVAESIERLQRFATQIMPLAKA